ncbi:hypothetical protein [Bradyrhizobium sp. WSM1743]|uniref:hypothetical protein n=1 Tax=Bradyrhizobium sp. WSM1743 TaxID=318996 RepID=UPI003527D4DE
MNNVDSFAWLALTIRRIANGWPEQRTQRAFAMEQRRLAASACRLPKDTAR